jgi:PTH2 family peptidyl-tRNA hydrolase
VPPLEFSVRVNRMTPFSATRPLMLPISPNDRVFILTGAGLSAESVIPTFRDVDGFWRNTGLRRSLRPKLGAAALSAPKEILERSNTDGQTKIALEARSFAELDSLKQRCHALGLTHVLISHAGRTELAPGTVTTLAVGPAEDQLVRKVTGSVPLLR